MDEKESMDQHAPEVAEKPLKKGPRTPPGSPPGRHPTKSMSPAANRRGPATPSNSPPAPSSLGSSSASYRGRSDQSETPSNSDRQKSQKRQKKPSRKKPTQPRSTDIQQPISEPNFVDQIAAMANVSADRLRQTIDSDFLVNLGGVNKSVLLATVKTVLSTIAHSKPSMQESVTAEVTSSMSPGQKDVSGCNEQRNEAVEMELESDSGSSSDQNSEPPPPPPPPPEDTCIGNICRPTFVGQCEPPSSLAPGVPPPPFHLPPPIPVASSTNPFQSLNESRPPLNPNIFAQSSEQQQQQTPPGQVQIIQTLFKALGMPPKNLNMSSNRPPDPINDSPVRPVGEQRQNYGSSQNWTDVSPAPRFQNRAPFNQVAPMNCQLLTQPPPPIFQPRAPVEQPSRPSSSTVNSNLAQSTQMLASREMNTDRSDLPVLLDRYGQPLPIPGQSRNPFRQSDTRTNQSAPCSTSWKNFAPPPPSIVSNESAERGSRGPQPPPFVGRFPGPPIRPFPERSQHPFRGPPPQFRPHGGRHGF